MNKINNQSYSTLKKIIALLLSIVTLLYCLPELKDEIFSNKFIWRRK